MVAALQFDHFESAVYCLSPDLSFWLLYYQSNLVVVCTEPT